MYFIPTLLLLNKNGCTLT